MSNKQSKDKGIEMLPISGDVNYAQDELHNL